MIYRKQCLAVAEIYQRSEDSRDQDSREKEIQQNLTFGAAYPLEAIAKAEAGDWDPVEVTAELQGFLWYWGTEITIYSTPRRRDSDKNSWISAGTSDSPFFQMGMNQK